MATISTKINEPKTFDKIQQEDNELEKDKTLSEISNKLSKVAELLEKSNRNRESSDDKELKQNRIELSKLQLRKAKLGLAREEKAYQKSTTGSVKNSSKASTEDDVGMKYVAASTLTGGAINPVILKSLTQGLHLDKIISAPLKAAAGGLHALGNVLGVSGRISGKSSSALADRKSDEKLYKKLDEIIKAIKDKNGTSDGKEKEKPSILESFFKKLLLGALGIMALKLLWEHFKKKIEEFFNNLIERIGEIFDNLTKEYTDAIRKVGTVFELLKFFNLGEKPKTPHNSNGEEPKEPKGKKSNQSKAEEDAKPIKDKTKDPDSKKDANKSKIEENTKPEKNAKSVKDKTSPTTKDQKNPETLKEKLPVHENTKSSTKPKTNADKNTKPIGQCTRKKPEGTMSMREQFVNTDSTKKEIYQKPKQNQSRNITNKINPHEESIVKRQSVYKNTEIINGRPTTMYSFTYDANKANFQNWLFEKTYEKPIIKDSLDKVIKTVNMKDIHSTFPIRENVTNSIYTPRLEDDNNLKAIVEDFVKETMKKENGKSHGSKTIPEAFSIKTMASKGIKGLKTIAGKTIGVIGNGLVILDGALTGYDVYQNGVEGAYNNRMQSWKNDLEITTDPNQSTGKKIWASLGVINPITAGMAITNSISEGITEYIINKDKTHEIEQNENKQLQETKTTNQLLRQLLEKQNEQKNVADNRQYIQINANPNEFINDTYKLNGGK